MISPNVENKARRRVRLKVERDRKRANALAAYLAERQREAGRTAERDVRDTTYEYLESVKDGRRSEIR